MTDKTYLLIFGCNGVKLSLEFKDLTEVYDYIIVNEFEQGYYQIYKAEKVI